jgi:hypothetical protein
MADVVDVVYVNIVTCSMGFVRVRGVAKGGQLIANQGQEWMGIAPRARKLVLQVSKKAGTWNKG